MRIALGLFAVLGTLWATYNGVTEFVDHSLGRRRVNSIWFGQDYNIKARAFAVAQDKIEAWSN